MNTYPAVPLIVLANGRLSHWRRINRESRLLDQFVNLHSHIMADSASVDEEDDVSFSFFDQLQDLIEDEFLDLWIVGGRGAGEGNFETVGGYGFKDQVGGEGEVDWAGLERFINKSRQGRWGKLRVPR
jgi:hypothetical protein